MTKSAEPAVPLRKKIAKGERALLEARLNKFRKVNKAQKGETQTDILSRAVSRNYLRWQIEKRGLEKGRKRLRVSRTCLHATRAILVAYIDRLFMTTASLMTLTSRTHVPSRIIDMASSMADLPGAQAPVMVPTNEAIYQIKKRLGLKGKKPEAAPAPKSRTA